MSKEAMKLALEALENSVDLVVEDAYNAEKLYGEYPTRQGKVGGLKILADQHKEAIAAIKEALAQPEQHSANEHLEPVAWPTMPPNKGQSPVLFEDGYAEGWEKCMSMCKAAFANTTPPQRKSLTDDEIDVAWRSVDYTVPYEQFRLDVAKAIEAAHCIKE